jgi:molybdopterin/thiamine biosynthesis adenylyltransferase/DNA-binding transcriptional regulator YhcF (GntR family)
MKINPVKHMTLAQIVAGRLAASILDGEFKSGDKLPSERVLMTQLGVSRATLREGLKALAQNRLIEVRPGVGSFIRPLDRSNYAQATELAVAHRVRGARVTEAPPISTSVSTLPQAEETERKQGGPRPLHISVEKPLRIPNLREDRLGTFEFISWWEREKVQAAKVMIVGAGALGNEVAKNLALMGIGSLYIVDFDTIEAANLSRSVLFRERDNGRPKAEIAAARVRELNPDVHVQYFNGDVRTQVGLGVFRRMDVIVGCLDNRESRLAINRFCYWMNKPWVDGAIQELLGLVRLFVPGEGACFECTLTEQARRDISLRYSCPLLARNNVLLGKVPTTPTIASIIGGMQSQEAFKLIHGRPVEAGMVAHFNGMTNQMHTTRYVPRENCESHWTYGEVFELPNRVEDTTLLELLHIARSDLGPEAVIELDQELVLSLECKQCNTVDEVMRPISDISYDASHCPVCGLVRQVHMTHVVTGEEPFLHRTLTSIGVPPLHILRTHNGRDYRFYELTGDLSEAFHFRHFEDLRPGVEPASKLSIRLGPEIHATEAPTADVASDRIRLVD